MGVRGDLKDFRVKILYILRREEDTWVQEVIDHARGRGEVSLLLIQDGVLSKLKEDSEIFASVHDVLARGITVSYKLIDYPEMCQLIVEHDKVIVW